MDQMKAQKFVQTHENILKEKGFDLTRDTEILDFGCGAGREVYQFRKMGYKAYGCDIKDVFVGIQKQCEAEKLIGANESIFRKIDVTNYKVPFADGTLIMFSATRYLSAHKILPKLFRKFIGS